MQKDDGVYVGHMLDVARQAVAKIQGRSRADYDADENLRLALTHLPGIPGGPLHSSLGRHRRHAA